MTGDTIRLEKGNISWLSRCHHGGAQEDLEHWIRNHHQAAEPPTGETDTDMKLINNFMSLYHFSEQTRFFDELDGTISAGLAVLDAIEPLEQVDHYVHRPSTWWHIATMISNAYSNRAQHSPSLELYEKAVKFQLGLVAATGESIYFFEDLLLGSWSSSRLAAMYIGQYEFSESADLFAIEEGLA
jgi:hypothetical protein